MTIRARLGASARGTPRVPPPASATAFYQTIEGNGVAFPQEIILNFVNGTNTTVLVTDDPGNSRTNVAINVAGAPPTGTAGGDLSGTYPNPAVRALTTAAGVGTQLLTGAIASGQALVRSGATIVGQTLTYQTVQANGIALAQEPILNFIAGTNTTVTGADDGGGTRSNISINVAGAPPTGTAGGDLSGTYPNPAVRALTTAAGAGTQLLTGTINDGQAIFRSGTSLVGKTLPDIQVITVSGNWTKPSPVPFWTAVYLVGGGAGGGSGRKGLTGTNRFGGGGGGGGAKSSVVFQTSLLGLTEAVVVGGAGAGGASQSTASTNGNNGNSGTASTFGTVVIGRAGGGTNGLGGTAATGIAGAGGTGDGAGGNGGTGSSSTGNIGGANPGAGGGAGGGGLNTTDTNAAGGTGGNRSTSYDVSGGGTAGTAGGGGGGNGGSVTANIPNGGAGGGGGGSNNAGNGGTGGNGGLYGAGGGGGGAAQDGAGNSGAGGNGSDGIVVVVSW